MQTNKIKSYTLVVESSRQDAIKKAHIKAKETFSHVSQIDFGIGRTIFFFVVAPIPSRLNVLSKNSTMESRTQRDFMDWCECENLLLRKKIFNVAQVEY